MKKIYIIIIILIVIALGIFVSFRIFNNKNSQDLLSKNTSIIEKDSNANISVEINSSEEITTPNTLIIYKTYYTKCKHYITRYENIDTSLVNLSKEELKEKCKEWKIEKFSTEEVELSKEEEKFCNEHYKLKLANDIVVVYNVDENGKETLYEETDITPEYLTKEDIEKLNGGIIIYGKENLTNAIEDYE